MTDDTKPHFNLDDMHLAWENEIGEEPDELWRVTSMRLFGDRELRHTEWFAREQDALDHAKWINAGRGRVLRVAKYDQVSSINP